MIALAALLAALAVLVSPRRGAGRDPAVPCRAAAAPESSAPTVDEAAAAVALVAAALRSGIGSVEALEAVSGLDDGPAGRDLAVVAAAHRWGEPADRAWTHVGPGWTSAAVAWHAAYAAGAAPSGLLEAAAARMRETEMLRVEAAVGRAAVLLVLPLGLCFLPGFVGTTVVPVVLRLLTGVGGLGAAAGG
jgi:pilus assembly protein TadC